MLYSAKQVATMCGLDENTLQTVLDRGHVGFTVVQQGARTYRKFDRDQLFALDVFARLTFGGVKPGVAGAWVEMMTYELASQAFQRGLKYLVFSDPRMGPHAVEQGDSLNKYLSGFVLDYPATQKNLDREIANLRYAKGEEGIAN